MFVYAVSLIPMKVMLMADGWCQILGQRFDDLIALVAAGYDRNVTVTLLILPSQTVEVSWIFLACLVLWEHHYI
jgi:hypothetical protein